MVEGWEVVDWGGLPGCLLYVLLAPVRAHLSVPRLGNEALGRLRGTHSPLALHTCS